VAEQVTVSGEYHGHPAWSPRGDRIAFVAGSNPQRRLPFITGVLRIHDLKSGEDRTIPTPYPLAGTLAWAPDGERIVVGLLTPGVGSLLHEIDLRNSSVRRLQGGVEKHEISNWVDSAWNPRDSREVFFAAARGGAPQVWSFRLGDPPVQIQLPLTRYRTRDIALLHSISPLPDGSAVIYSADATNGRGNYELYRVPANGGEPVALTRTERDEFAPAVSPDGKWVAHVSNQFGNIDLFLTPVSGGESHHVAITRLDFRRPAGWVRLRVEDEAGRPTAARVYVIASDGKTYAPQGTPVFFAPFDAARNREGMFLASGDDRFPAPAGRLTVTVVKGLEYEVADGAADVPEGGTAEVTIRLRRWANWLDRGWLTGENHFHANYNGVYYQRPRDSLQWLEAEDLNTATMMVANSEGAFVHDKEFFTGSVSTSSTDRRILYWGQEYRNDYVLGHMAFLNLKRLVSPSFTSVPGSSSPYDYPLNTSAALQARGQGGAVSYVHPHYHGREDVFDTWYGAKELPVTAAFGAVDSIDVLPSGEPAYELWYRLLNSGLRIPAGAGTDCFTNYRGLHRVPGSGRIYARVGAARNWPAWLAAYRAGQNFVTTGPLVSFEVDGLGAGSEISAEPGRPHLARVRAEAIWRAPLRRIEVIRNGEVVASREAAPGARDVRIEAEVRIGRSSWIAVRVAADPGRGLGSSDAAALAHTSPVWILSGGQPVLEREDIEYNLRWIDRLWALLEERDNFGPEGNRERARAMFEQARRHYRAKLSTVRYRDLK
jgi:hypothetical protein